MPEIHPTAIVSPEAELAEGVVIGPHVTIEPGARIGRGTRIGTGSYIFSGTSIGEENDVHMYVVIGNAPQDWHYGGDETFVEIGDRNLIREFVTVHRGTPPGSTTKIGNENLLYATSHVAHNCVIGDGITLANGALLGGHVEVGSRAFISGHALVHQFARVGRLAMIAGGARMSRDTPPFCMMEGESRLRGLNRVGLRRAGFSAEQLSEVGRAYRKMFMSGERPEDAARELLGYERPDSMTHARPSSQARRIGGAGRTAQPLLPEVREMAEFVLSSCTDPKRRGVCLHRRRHLT